MKFAQPVSIKWIAELINAETIGSAAFEAYGINEIHKVEEGDLCFVDHPKYYNTCLNSAATHIIINTKNVSANELVKFAETLKGIRYKYGSMKKENGFDCSGFISYVFTHFKIPVPRTSVDFTNAGKEVLPEFSRRGDIILFTGSNAKSGVVGHMGIITQNKNGDIQFIHASESRGVMISRMNSYFLPRFVKVNRVFSNFK